MYKYGLWTEPVQTFKRFIFLPRTLQLILVKTITNMMHKKKTDNEWAGRDMMTPSLVVFLGSHCKLEKSVQGTKEAIKTVFGKLTQFGVYIALKTYFSKPGACPSCKRSMHY